MFEEGQLYSPVTQRDDGKVEVHLGEDHPGFNDQRYRERRNEIAAAAMAWSPGEPGPADRLHRGRGRDLAHGLPRAARQAREVRLPRVPGGQGGARPARGPRAAARRGHRRPAAADRLRVPPGARAGRRCASSTARSADRVFHSTQYVRHPSEPLYTPEPDIIHEVIGHGNMLASPRFAAHQAPGRPRPPSACETDEALQVIADVFWFTHRVRRRLREDGELRAYGAGILSCYGEIEEFRHMEIRPLDFAEMGDHRVRHHQVPAGPLRGRVDGPPRGGGRRVLRGGRRRDAVALRARAALSRRPGAGAPDGVPTRHERRVRRSPVSAFRQIRCGYPFGSLRPAVSQLPWPTAR